MAIVEQERVREYGPPQPPPPETKPTEADVLERAAYYYDEGIYEWYAGNYRGPNDERCVTSMLIQTARNLGNYSLWPGAAKELSNIVGLSQTSWNDRVARDKAEVVAKLREAAARARGE